MSSPVAAINSRYSEVLIWGSVGVAAVVLMGFGLMWFRKKYHPDSMSNSAVAGFSITSIEEMRDRGMISDEEFRRLRVSSLGLAPSIGDNGNSALSGPSDVDDGTEEPQEIDQSNKPQEDHKESK